MRTAVLVLALALAGAHAFGGDGELPLRLQGGLAAKLRGRTALRGSVSADSTATIQQVLDHTNPGSTTFPQKFMFDLSLWDRNAGPVFVDIGGEGPLTATPQGYIRSLAKMFNAAVFALEHRFYGSSVPNNDLSTANLQYLTIDNALADVNAFIAYIRATYNVKPLQKVFTFGGSYSGALSAWFRKAYPAATSGSLSSSGVVNAFTSFPQFDEQVTTALQTGVPSTCLPAMRATTTAFEATLAAGGATADAAKALFNVPTMSNVDFLFMLADGGAMAVQYGHKDQLCAAVKPAGTDAEYMQQYADFINAFWGATFAQDCFYDTACLTTDTARWGPFSRSWRWQTCLEVGWFNVAPATNSIRSTQITLQYHLDQCQAVFGQPMDPTANAAALNTKFGGANPTATKVFYSQASDDPWQGAGLQVSLGPLQPEFTANCSLCGHCGDLHAPSDTDPPNLTRQRAVEAAFIDDWLRSL